MFIRVKSTPNSPRQSVQIVESVRHGKRVRQKIVRHVGVASEPDEIERLKDLAEFIKAKLEADIHPTLFPAEQLAQLIIDCRRRRDSAALPVNLKQLRETGRIVSGIHDVYGQAYQDLGLHQLLPAQRYRTSNEVLCHCVMARLANPKSKRASVGDLATNFGVQIPLQRVYRMMDALDERFIARLNALAAEQAASLLGTPLRVLFFDCTTLYFESFCDDELKQPGYSKDGKFKECQVLLALMVTETGLPVHHLVLPGASFEGHSLVPVLEALRKDYDIQQAVVVADRGMMNQANLNSLREAGLHYVVGAKLKTLPKTLQAKILDHSGYQPLTDDGVQVRTLTGTDPADQLVVSYSPCRAKRDRMERDKAVERLRRKLQKSSNPKQLLNGRGHAKFLQLDGEAQLSINADRVAEQEQWDGLHGVVTNLPASTEASAILHQYWGLWQVEETFRVSKHDLRVRPVYHWTPRRVRAHIAMAFMSLMCVRHLQYRVAVQKREAVSAEVICNALTQVQHSVLEDQKTQRRYALPSTISEVGRKLYQVMGLTHDMEPFELK